MGWNCGMFFFFGFGVYKGVWFGEEKVFGLRKISKKFRHSQGRGFLWWFSLAFSFLFELFWGFTG